MYKIMFGDNEFTDYLFKTKEDAEFFILLADIPGLVITPAYVFSRKFWYSLTPYVAWFDESGQLARVIPANPIFVDGMMESKLVIRVSNVTSVNKNYVMVAFWDSTKDIEKATIIANSLFEGWKAGNG